MPGVTVNRLCGSGLEAINQAWRAIAVGDADVVIAGGSESMSRAPAVVARPERAYQRVLRMEDSTIGWRFPNAELVARWGEDALGETAENVAVEYGVSRRRQDEVALRSHEQAVAAFDADRFADELLPVEVRSGRSGTVTVATDEAPRRDTSLSALSELVPPS